MRWNDGSHRPRMMTVDEFKAMGYDRSRSEWALCYDAEGNRKPEDDMKILVGPICGGIRLKTHLTDGINGVTAAGNGSTNRKGREGTEKGE